MTERLLESSRPDPDALLAEIQQGEKKSQRGKLKVFFGASPGVGKTYAMLEEGRNRAAEGLDVVVGYAEPHARPDTEALILGMELLPYDFVEYRNVRLKEFDLDAALKRKPALLLIDELAHTNAPGMRHPKRWQDVMEVLDAGIDVYTTLNVQHLESANDIVQRITGITVRETLPDSVLEKADEVELVDISPDELLERLGEGKIYQPEVAERATRNFFSKGNLIALRELALRRTAERVDAQMDEFRRENRVKELWPAMERLLVCVSPSPLSARLIRATKRLANASRADWVAVYVETPSHQGISQGDRDRVNQTLRLAQQLGAETVTLNGQNIVDELINFAHLRNVNHIVIGKPETPRWRELFTGSLVDELIRKSGKIDIHVIRGEPEELPSTPEPHPVPPIEWNRYVWATLAVAATTGIAALLYVSNFVKGDLSNLVMIYLLGVVIVATRFRRGPAIYASILSVAAFDFFFVEPRFTFAVSDWKYLVTFFVMLAVAMITSTLTSRIQLQVESSRKRELRTRALLALAGELAATREMERIVDAAVKQIAGVFDCDAVILLPDANQKLEPSASRAKTYKFDEKEAGVARWVFDHDQPAGLSTMTLPGAQGLYLPLIASQGTVGVLGVCPASVNAFNDPEQMRLIEAFANQSAAAIERAKLATDARAAWERVEAEFLRNTLLSGVSHDLRTPLAAITGSISTIAEAGDKLAPTGRQELLENTLAEAERMDRQITNLLDMTRLESGGALLKQDWHSVTEIVGTTVKRLERRLAGRKVSFSLPADLPLVYVDETSMQQVLANLLDNAVEYTPAGSVIDIAANMNRGNLQIEISDRGPGLPPGTESRVFEKFFRASGNGSRRGVGLGLAICRGIIAAHGGTIVAMNRPGGGATFQITLPMSKTPPSIDEAKQPHGE